MELVEEFKIKNLPKRKRIGIVLMSCAVMIFVIEIGRYLPRLSIQDVGFINWSIMVVAVLIFVVVIHEGLHGLFFWLFSRKVKFGFRLKGSMGPAFWTSSPGSLIPRLRFQIVGLAPQILTVMLLLLLTPMPTILKYGLLWAVVFNLGGGGPDIFGVIYLRRYPRSCLVEDVEDGMRIYKG